MGNLRHLEAKSKAPELRPPPASATYELRPPPSVDGHHEQVFHSASFPPPLPSAATAPAGYSLAGRTDQGDSRDETERRIDPSLAPPPGNWQEMDAEVPGTSAITGNSISSSS